jgi:hypothetical protein
MIGLTFGAIGTVQTHTTAASAPARTGESAADAFLNYMKESPAERMAESWLAAHGLSQEKLAAMTPEQRDAVLKQMAKEIKDAVAQATQQTLEKKTRAL